MSDGHQALLTGVETRMTRRTLLLSLPAAAMARSLLQAQGTPGTLKLRALNHMTVNVRDPKRSIEFYQGLFGMPIQSRQGNSTTQLRVGPGPQYMSIGAVGANGTPGISHYCVTVDDFSVDRVLKVLAEHGVQRVEGTGGGGLSGGAMKVRVRMRGPEVGGAPGGTPEIYVGDPDGIIVQIQDPKYCGGGGVLGDVCDPNPPAVKGLIALKEYSHFTITSSDGAKTTAWFRSIFGAPIRSYQGPTAPTVAIGPGVAFMMFTGGGGAGRAGAPPAPPRQPSINHVCFSLENFNPDQVIKTLEGVGIKPRETPTGPVQPMRHYISMRMENRGGAPGGTPELYFTDPDGILVQLQDVKYCGGGGFLGDTCPPIA
jgi:catechol 2,3-dioxygenase-like lactoylglutathione lyase family enzyme